MFISPSISFILSELSVCVPVSLSGLTLICTKALHKCVLPHKDMKCFLIQRKYLMFLLSDFGFILYSMTETQSDKCMLDK